MIMMWWVDGGCGECCECGECYGEWCGECLCWEIILMSFKCLYWWIFEEN